MGSREKKRKKNLAQGKTPQGGHESKYNSMAEEGTLGKKERTKGKRGRNDSRAKRIKDGEQAIVPKPPTASTSYGGGYSGHSYVSSRPPFSTGCGFSSDFESRYGRQSSSRTPDRPASSLSGHLREDNIPLESMQRREEFPTMPHSESRKEPEIDYTKIFTFERVYNGCKIKSSNPIGTTIWEVIKTGDYEKVCTLYGVLDSLEEAGKCLMGLKGLEQELIAIRSLIQKNTASQPKIQQVSGAEVDELKEKFVMSLWDSKDYEVEANFDSKTNITLVESTPSEYTQQVRIRIHTSSGEVYNSFKLARTAEEKNADFLRELSALEGMIKEKGGEVF